MGWIVGPGFNSRHLHYWPFSTRWEALFYAVNTPAVVAGCDCNVQPVPPDMENNQVIDEDLLEQAHATVEDRYGTFDPRRT